MEGLFWPRITRILNPDFKSVLSVAQFYRKHRATFRGISSGQRTAVLSDDAVRQSQTDAMTFCLCCEKRNEDFLQV